ncbi:uroporphyrinogen-III synthase [Sphingobium sufflavum]|uniref:uroporphyrinogen-III synthase n=1 Tax=Sphingobium sufflavum TaxID=1129547 RepID=UPI001F1F6546|nr:uroporphyrinogen-III synthase [Sphingobium sufflavum]MCE7795667.1 uroporphyrinogen-III synthase [Sphingobium sufflavum]
MAEPVLVLRPEPGATRTGEALGKAGFRPVSYPLYVVETVEWTPPDPAQYDAVLVTSANAMRLGGPGVSRYCRLPLFAVGEASARAAQRAGFRDVTTGGGNAPLTLPLIVAAGYSRILHLCGMEVREVDDLGLSITRLPVYGTMPTGDAQGLAQALPREREIFALVHSPRAGGRLAELVSPADRDRITILAISGAASEACGEGWHGRVIAGAATDAALLAGLQMLV